MHIEPEVQILLAQRCSKMFSIEHTKWWVVHDHGESIYVRVFWHSFLLLIRFCTILATYALRPCNPAAYPLALFCDSIDYLFCGLDMCCG